MRLRSLLRYGVYAAIGCAWVIGVAAPVCANAQEYPAKPIKLIVPFAAGSVQDLRARHIGNLLGPRLGAPVVIENRPGANGALGTSLVAKAKPDGYTLLLCTSATLSANPALMPDLPYDTMRDFVPVARLVTTFGVVAVDGSSKLQTLQQLLAAARLKPGSLRYGAGSSYAHVLGELLSKRAGVDLLLVPYKGDGQALTDLVGGHIDLMFSTPMLLVPQAKAGRIRALAIAGPRRLAGLPDAPTLAEQGVPGSELPAWAGLCAPAGTPPTVVGKINREALAAMTSPEVKADVESQGYEVSANTPEEFLAFLKMDMSRTAGLVKDLAIPPEQ